MKTEILKMVEEIKTEWGLRKALCFLRVLLEEEAKKESPREGQDQGEQRAQGAEDSGARAAN